jgi:hypothetical protein
MSINVGDKRKVFFFQAGLTNPGLSPVTRPSSRERTFRSRTTQSSTSTSRLKLAWVNYFDTFTVIVVVIVVVVTVVVVVVVLVVVATADANKVKMKSLVLYAKEVNYSTHSSII